MQDNSIQEFLLSQLISSFNMIFLQYVCPLKTKNNLWNMLIKTRFNLHFKCKKVQTTYYFHFCHQKQANMLSLFNCLISFHFTSTLFAITLYRIGRLFLHHCIYWNHILCKRTAYKNVCYFFNCLNICQFHQYISHKLTHMRYLRIQSYLMI